MEQSETRIPVVSAGATYDETPYPSTAFPDTHPDRLCAMARLFGLDAPAPATARVLELGCADGTNLLPMAQRSPAARFLGIDASARHAAAAQAAITAAGLDNVEIRHQDLMDFPPAEGKFDYIIAHGLFSWVPEPVRDKILAICREHLSENGVAYVSYNCFPGWGMRMALREMMLYHTASFVDSKAKIGQARALTAFLADAVPSDNPYGLLLRQELEKLKANPDGYVRHDYLEETNQPCYFHEFVDRAMRAGLQYLSEPSLEQMLASNFSERVAQTLEQISGNIIAKEQYMDFVRNRNFRRTLLCHRAVNLRRNLSPDSIRTLYYTSRLQKPESGTLDLRPGIKQGFKLLGSNSVAVETDSSFLKATFDVLSEHTLDRVSFDQLLTIARERSNAYSESPGGPDREKAEENTLLANLLPLYARGLIEIFADRPRLTPIIAEKPKASPLARYQALHAANVVNQAHQVVPVDPLARYVISACNGQRDRPAIVEHLVAMAKEGKLTMAENEQQVTDESRMRLILTDRVDRVLLQMAARGFFVEV